MAIDSTLAARKAGLTLLKASSPLVALVPKAQIHPQSPPKTPLWPFILWGSASSIPIVGTCLDGQEITVAVHAFAKARTEEDTPVETAEDFASRIGALIAKTLDRRKADVPGGRLTFAWRGSQLLLDGNDAFHSVQNFRIRAITN